MFAAARDSNNPYDFALVCLLGLLELRISEATTLHITDLGEEHRHRVLRVIGKGHKIVLVPMPSAEHARSTAPSAAAWTGTSRGAGCIASMPPAGVQIARMHPHMLRHTFVSTMLDAGVDLRDTQIAA